MLVEVKSSPKAFQKAKKQLLDGKEKLVEVLSALGLSSALKFVGVFYAHNPTELPMFDCDPCSIFSIVGESEIQEKMKNIEEIVLQSHENRNASINVEDYVEIAKHLLFIAQG